MTTPGQVQFSGETISGLEFTISGLTLDTVPEGLTWEELGDFAVNHRIRFEGEAVLENTPYGESKHDAGQGDETGGLKGKLKFKFYRNSFKVTAFQSAAERDASWRRDHGATEAG